MTRTKIICTLGPASDSPSVLRRMMLAGMDVVRLNFSHGAFNEHQKRLDLIRSLNQKYRRAIKILQDLEGYRIRVGALAGGKPLEVKKRQRLFLTNKETLGHDLVIPFDYTGSLQDIKPGSHIYIDDGSILAVVRSHTTRYLQTEVVIGGLIKEHKGINIPDVTLRFQGLTQKDKTDLGFAIKNKVEYIAQSFVRDAKDILHLRVFLGRRLEATRIIAKIENRQGIQNLDSILEVCDGILIARGDMGVCLPIYEIPMIQKKIIRKCNRKKKLVITATQMLESMTENIRPTRAEVADVANAVLDGCDCLMLSAETAVGKHPAEAVEMMNDIIKFTETHGVV